MIGGLSKNAEIPEVFDRHSVNLLHGKLTKELAAQYNKFGIQVGLSMAQIETFSRRTESVTDHIYSMLSEWCKMDKPLSDIFDALESEAVGQRALAKELRVKWSDYNSKWQRRVVFPLLSDRR